jgi:hypothetical protein
MPWEIGDGEELGAEGEILLAPRRGVKARQAWRRDSRLAPYVPDPLSRVRGATFKMLDADSVGAADLGQVAVAEADGHRAFTDG